MFMLHTIGFMALAAGLLYGATFTAGTLSKDSATKEVIARQHYAQSACYSVGDRDFDTHLNGYHVVKLGESCTIEKED